MSNRFHSKYHRFNHHTSTNLANPDAGHDPIASPDSPFLGDFHLKGSLSAFNNDLNSQNTAYFGNKCIGLVAEGGNMAIKACGNSCVIGDLYVTGSVNASDFSIGNIVDTPDPVFYNFSSEFLTNEGLSSTQVSIKIDNESIKINNANQLIVNYQPVYDQFISLVNNLTSTTENSSGVNIVVGSSNFTNDYLFGSGLAAGLVTSTVESNTYSVSAKVDQQTITFNEQGQLSLTEKYSYGSGLSANTATGILQTYIDEQTLVFNSIGQIKGNYIFNGCNSGLITNGINSVSANVDGTSTFIQDGKIVSGYKFSSTASGLDCTPGAGDLPSLSIKVNNSTLKINPITGTLDTQNVLVTNLPNSEVQNIGGVVNFTGSVLACCGINFSDGSILQSASNTRQYVDKLSNLINNASTGSVVTSDNRVINWGNNNQFAVGNSRTKIWPPCVLPFEGNYLEANKIYGVKIKKIIQSSYITMVLLSNGTLWASGANTAGMLGVGKFTLDPKTNAQIHFAKVFNLCPVLGFPSGTVIDDFSFASIYNSALSRAEAAFAAVSSTGRAFFWGFNFRNMFGSSNTGALLPIISTTPFTPYSPILNDYFYSDVKKIHLTADYFKRDKFDDNTVGTANNGYQPYYRGSSYILTYNAPTSAGRVYAAGWDQYFQLGVGASYGANFTTGIDKREVRTFQIARNGDYLSGNGPLFDIQDILNVNPRITTVTFLKTTGNQIKIAGLNGNSNAFGTTNVYNTGNPGVAVTNTTTYPYFVTHPTLINVQDLKIVGGGDFPNHTANISIYAITTDGLYVWGNNNSGQLGLPYTLPTKEVPSPQTNRTTPFKLTDFVAGSYGLPSKIIVPNFETLTNKPLVGIITTNKNFYLAGFRNPVQYSDFTDLGVVGFKLSPIANVEEAQISTEGQNVAGILMKDSYNRVVIYSLILNSSFGGSGSDFIYPPAEISSFLV